MAAQSFTLASNVTVNNSVITGNGAFTVWTSSTINNNNGIQSLRVIIDYYDPSPVDVSITAIIESEQSGNWFPIAYQFSPFVNIGNGKQRIIILQPNISADNSGIDDDIYVGNIVLARVSRQQGKVGSSFRIRLVVNEQNYGVAAFQSIKVNIYGELFD